MPKAQVLEYEWRVISRLLKHPLVAQGYATKVTDFGARTRYRHATAGCTWMPKKGQTPMQFGTYPLAHLGLRVSDLGRAKRFYIDTLGFGLLRESSEAVFMDAHGLLIALIGPTEQTDDTDRFDPFRVGLDHLALAIAAVGDLDGLRRQLDDASVPNHGIEQDPVTGATYISFYDPDGIAWELYAMPAR